MDINQTPNIVRSDQKGYVQHVNNLRGLGFDHFKPTDAKSISGVADPLILTRKRRISG